MRWVAIAMCLLASGATAQTLYHDWQGSWTGTGVQDNLVWDVEVRFARSGAAVEYPSLGCGGYWIYDRYETPSRSEERIFHGLEACANNSIVRVNKDDNGTLTVHWFKPNGDVYAHGTLRRGKRAD